MPLLSLSLLPVLCPELQPPCRRERRAPNPMRTRRMRSIAPWRYTTLSRASQRNLLFRPDRGSTGKNALTSCMMLLPPPLSLTSVRTFLFSSWPSPTGGLKWKTICNVHIFDVLLLATAVHIFIKTDSAWAQIPQHDRPLPDLWATIARLLARRQPHSAPSLHTAWTIQQIVTAEFRILEVLNYELTTPTPATWIEVFKHRLSLWEELRTSTGVPPVHSAGTNHRVR